MLEGGVEILGGLGPGPILLVGHLWPQGQVPVERRHPGVALRSNFSHTRRPSTVQSACCVLLQELGQTHNIISLWVENIKTELLLAGSELHLAGSELLLAHRGRAQVRELQVPQLSQGCG